MLVESGSKTWFRHLPSFNLALLTKQGWRITKLPETFAARVLKAQNYAHTTFGGWIGFSANLFIWRSLL